jgi:hypothetical protein
MSCSLCLIFLSDYNKNCNVEANFSEIPNISFKEIHQKERHTQGGGGGCQAAALPKSPKTEIWKKKQIL